MFAAAAISIISAFALLGALSGRTSRAKEYTIGDRSASEWGVTGVLLGALVGGASTVGTVEMAYQWGFSAWHFTLGGGIGCLLLGLRLAAPLRNSGLVTVPQFLCGHFGRATATTAMLSSTIGTFLSVVAQFLSGTALLCSVLPLSEWEATLVVAVLISGFVLGGGLRSFAAVGTAKILFLYAVMCAMAIAAFLKGATPAFLSTTLAPQPWLNLFGRGLEKDGSALLSLVTGVLSTQIYIQSLLSARDAATARKGALISAFLMPPLGLCGVLVGLAMRAWGIDVPPSQALAHFLSAAFPPAVAGALWAGILITVVGCAAGLVFGIATNLVQDLLVPFLQPSWDEGRILAASRFAVLVVIGAAATFSFLGSERTILSWSFLSMGLRSAGTCLPLFFAILRPGTLPTRWALASSACGIVATISWPIFGLAMEPFLGGLAASALCAVIGAMGGRRGR